MAAKCVATRPAAPAPAPASTVVTSHGGCSLLQVTPLAIEFESFEPNTCYVSTLVIRNTSNRVVRFRLSVPSASSPFHVLHKGEDLAKTDNPTVTLSAGLTCKYDVTFQAKAKSITTIGSSSSNLSNDIDGDAILHDSFQIRADDQSCLEIPLMARKALPQFEFDSLCDFGLVVLSHRVTRIVKVRNVGTRTGNFEIEVVKSDSTNPASNTNSTSTGPNDWIHISPLSGQLMPNEEISLKVEVVAKELTAFRLLVCLHIKEVVSASVAMLGGGYQVDRILDVCGTIVEHNVELVANNSATLSRFGVGSGSPLGGKSDPSNAITSLTFGTLFAGEEKRIETFLRNNGPQPLVFNVSLAFGGKRNGGDQYEDDREAFERRKELSVSPVEGRIEPFSQLPVTFVYKPRRLDSLPEKRHFKNSSFGQDHDDSSHLTADSATSPLSSQPDRTSLSAMGPCMYLNAFASIHCTDINQNLTYEVSGKAFLPLIELTPSELDFGDCKSDDRVDILVNMKNRAGLPIKFSISRAAHFSAKPCSGRLDVLQSQTIIMSFHPKQLGSFKSNMEVVINNGIATKCMQVQGTAAAMGQPWNAPKELPGGPLALPKDFEPNYKFMLPEDAKKTKRKLVKKFERIPPYQLAALNGTAAIDKFEFQHTSNTHLTYCVNELAVRAEHREKYQEYLKEQRLKREGKHKLVESTKQKIYGGGASSSDEDFHTDINLEMSPQSGIAGPVPSLPKPEDALWLQSSLSARSGGPSGAGTSNTAAKAKIHFDENRFVKKKFKTQPVTQAEIAYCNMALEFDQLEQILRGPKSINFGKISVNSVTKKSFTVVNNLGQSIQVVMQVEEEGFGEVKKHTTPTSQVIPAGAVAGFDIGFCSSTEQFFQKHLRYTINGVHSSYLTLVAEVAPIFVQLSRQELVFDFSVTDTNASMSMEVAITNQSDSTAPFQWDQVLLTPPGATTQDQRPDSSKSSSSTKSTQQQTIAKKAYEIFPPSGQLKPKETQVCRVVFTPPTSLHDKHATWTVVPNDKTSNSNANGNWVENDFKLSVTGGKNTYLKCRGFVNDVKCTIKEKKLEFGTIAAGTEKDKRITIINTEQVGVNNLPVVFYVSIEPPVQGITISPSVGSILPQDTREIVVKLLFFKTMIIENVSVVIQLRGAKSTRLPLTANVLVPDARIVQSNIDFGNVIIGVSVPKVMSLENKSTIPASLMMDLTSASWGDFSISLPASLTDKIEDISSIFIPIMDTIPTAGTSPVAASASASSDDPGSEPSDSNCSKWQVVIPPSTTVSFHLNFTPKRAQRHEMWFPIQFVGLTIKTEHLQRKILATGTTPRLLFSSSWINFGKCVITREGIRKVPYTKQLVLTNNDTKLIKWSIDVSKFRLDNSKRMSVFHIAPERGELAPDDELKVRVSFLPLEPLEYIDDAIPLLLDDAEYIKLKVSGTGIHPHLSFSENKIVLPVVPLGVKSIAKFFIQNTGYDHLELNYRIPLDSNKAPIELVFPEGKTLSMASPKIPAEIHFCSNKSVAFSARVEFFDTDANQFNLPVVGCTENCLLTTYNFIQTHQTRAPIATNLGSGPGVPTSVASGSAASGTFQFYTHPNYRGPIYFLNRQQLTGILHPTEVHSSRSGSDKSSAAKSPQSKGNHAVASSASGPGGAATSKTHPPSAGGSHESDHIAVDGVLEVPCTHVAVDDPVVQSEIRFLMQFLNANFLRTPLSRFPEDFADAFGKPLYDLLDMVCTKQVPGRVVKSLQTKKDQQSSYTTQYTELLRFLKSFGAMVHDVAPEHLLNQDLYVRVLEDPRADVALLSSPALLGMTFLQRRKWLEREWKQVSTEAWLRVVYQVLKCFVLYRITSKTHCATLGITSFATKRDLTGSNVYSESEMVLIQWICDRLRAKLPAIGNPERMLLDFDADLKSGSLLFQLVASHIPTFSSDNPDYRCFQLLEPDASSLLSEEMIAMNAQTLQRVLTNCGVEFGIPPEKFLVGMNARESLLLVLHLYQLLPQFIPKATIEFKGVLGQTIEKNIELRNPSSKIIRYHVFVDSGAGSTAFSGRDAGDPLIAAPSEFHIESDVLMLEPGKTVSFRVSFQPRFSRKVSARLVFQSVRDSFSHGGSGATMVFLLESNILSRKPVRVIQMESNTYEKKVDELLIENQFAASGNFKLSLVQHGATNPGGGHHSSRKKNPQASMPTKDDWSWCMDAQQAFHVVDVGSPVASPENNIVLIKASGQTCLKLEFLPLRPGNYKCQMLFLDEKVGEFLYEVQATAYLPLSIETLEFTCETRPHVTKEILLPPRNAQLTKALSNLIDRSNGLLKTRLKEGLRKCEETHHVNFSVDLNSPFFSPLFSEITISSSAKVPAAKSHNFSGGADNEPTPNDEAIKPNTHSSKSIARVCTPRGTNGGGRTLEKSGASGTYGLTLQPNSVLLNFEPKSAGVYNCKMMLSSNSVCGSIDIRIYDLVVKVKEPNIKTLLEFAAPARHSIVQEIPLTNNSATAWNLRAVFDAKATMFSGPSSFQVPANKTASYPLTFKPQWITQEHSMLTLINTTTQQQFEFELVGHGEEPLAQDHISLTCQARTSLCHEFEVLSFKTDPAGEQKYKVESDLRDVSGPSSVIVPRHGGIVNYPLTFTPLVSGTYFGSITFTNVATNEYIWYTIEAQVSPPAPQDTLEMRTMVRNAMGVEISLQNPLDHRIEFHIDLQGDGLLGPATFELDAGASDVYQLIYSPLRVLSPTNGALEGAILFSNQEIGQFWYKLLLFSEPAPPIELDEMTCAVGDACSQPIVLQNPSDKELTLQFRITNPRNFSIRGTSGEASGQVKSSNANSSQPSPSIVVPPYGTATVILEYTPSSLSEFESSSIVFFCPNVVSDWEFSVRGIGKVPSTMKPILISARVGEAASTLFTFKNPFSDSLKVEVQLIADKLQHTVAGTSTAALPSGGSMSNFNTGGSVFDLLFKKKQITLEGFGHLPVPISFIPQFVSEASAEIVIKGDGDLEWHYPVRGLAEAPVFHRSFTFACQARESCEKRIQCELLALPPHVSVEDQFVYEWEIPPVLQTSNAIFERFVTVTPLVDRIEDVTNPVLQYQIRMEPLRPYHGSVYFCIKKKTGGGKWRFEVVLDISDPPLDDLICIESSLNQTSSVSFQLRNQFREKAAFKADFSAGSSNAFTVYPSEGILPPYGSDESMTLVVSFTPTAYGKMQSGQLIVLTEEMQWTFNVKGSFPEYKVSNSSGSGSFSQSRSRSMESHGSGQSSDSASPNDPKHQHHQPGSKAKDKKTPWKRGG